MTMVNCRNGHLYDDARSAFCPECRKAEFEKNAGGSAEPVKIKNRRVEEFDAAHRESQRSAGRCLKCMNPYRTLEEVTCPYCGYRQGIPPKERFHLYPGTVLRNRYMIGTVQGFGGFGITYRAWDMHLGTMVAVKEYYPSGMASQPPVRRNPGQNRVIIHAGKEKIFNQGLKRFLDEAITTAKFSGNPNVVGVLDYFEENGTAYMVMEFLHGEDLAGYMERKGGRVDVGEAVNIFSFLADAVGSLHEQGIIHRDLSPDNFFICRDGSVKLMDLGAARFSSTVKDEDKTVILKIGYAPPEQYAKDGRQGPWTDVYALSASLYKCITGVDPEESTDRLKKDDLIPPSEWNSEIPEYLDNVILRGMSLKADMRFQTMNEFRDALRGETVTRNEADEFRRRRTRRFLIAVSVFAALSGAIFAGAKIYQNQKRLSSLEDARLEIWIPYEEEKKELTEACFREMTEEFSVSYPAASVEYVMIPEEEYQDRLEKALSKGKGPDLFESSSLDRSYRKKLGDVSPVLERLTLRKYYFLPSFDQFFKEKKWIPLGAECLAAYGNLSLLNSGENTAMENSISAFLAGETSLYIGSTSELPLIEQALPGYFGMIPVPEERNSYAFTSLWSVNENCSRADHQAACTVLYFWLGESAQETLHVQYRCGLPILRKTDTVYREIYSDLNEIGDLSAVKKVVNIGQLAEEAEKEFSRSGEVEKLLTELKKKAKEAYRESEVRESE